MNNTTNSLLMRARDTLTSTLKIAHLIIFLGLTAKSNSEELKFRKIDMTNGLSFNSVLCLMEDNKGRLWVGTREGLNQYNGYEFKIFKHNPYNNNSLSNNHINVIYQTKRNEIWIGTSNGLNQYQPDTETFVSYLAPPDSSELSNNYVKTIAESTTGEIWVGTSNGISIYDPITQSFSHVFPAPPSSESNNIIALLQDREHQMWVGAKDGLFLWEDGQFRKLLGRMSEHDNRPIEIRDIKQDSKGDYWLATENSGLINFTFKNKKFRLLNHWEENNSAILTNQIRQLYIDKERIWLATLKGLSILDSKRQTFNNIEYSIEKPDGISRGSVHDILKDKFGGYWIATYSGGLNYYHKQNNIFKHYKRTAGIDSGISENDVNGFLEGKDGSIWIATGKGLNHKNIATNKFHFYGEDRENGLSNRIIKCMVADPRGNLWIGTYNGLNYFDIEKQTFSHFFHKPGENSINQNQIHALHLDKDGLLWIGMNMGEFQVYNTKTGEFSNVPDIGNIVSYIYEDRKGRLWIGTRAGLKCMQRENREIINISHIIHQFESELLFVNWIMEDSRGYIWLGTQSSGLFLIRHDEIFWFGEGNQLNSNTINAILEDRDGYLWISTNAGISKLSYREDAEHKPRLDPINFSHLQGLQGPQFNPASAFKSSKGLMYFGGINGFNVFDPLKVRKESTSPKVLINSINILADSNKPELQIPKEQTDSTLLLSYNQRNVTIHFSGINFVNSEETEYRYRISNKNNSWFEIGTQRTLNFSEIPIGEHHLQIQATTHPLLWGGNTTTLKINVLPPWWLSTWAYFSYLLIFSALLYVFFKISQRWAQLKSKLSMEKVLHENEQRSYEKKLDFFTDISHELRTPLTLILAPIETIGKHPALHESLKKDLQIMRKNGQKMMELINQVLDLRRLESSQHSQLKASSNDLDNLLKEIALSFSSLACQRNIDFNCIIEPDLPTIWFDSKKMESIILNLLSNAFKHTPENGQITLSAKPVNGNQIPTTHKRSFSEYVLISIRDSGEGMTEETVRSIFSRYTTNKGQHNLNPTGVGIGLDLTKRMVELHQGHIDVETKIASAHAPSYTEFKVFLPKTAQDSPYTGPDSEDNSMLIKTDLQDVELPDLNASDKQTLLLVEDNPEVRNLIKEIFITNYHVIEAKDGDEGWLQATKTIPDLIISDIMMPGINGIDLCKKLKQDVRTSHIPVILLTARATSAFKYQGFETGADAYITKPFSPDYLLLRVKNLIRQQNNIKQFLQRATLLKPETISINSVDDKLLIKTLDFIEQNISDHRLNIEQISTEIGLSRMHFHRKIKSLTGMTPAEFVKTTRLNKAAAILAQNKVSIKEVMTMVGFENADHFRKCFKEHYGKTPSEYMKDQ